MYNLRHDIKPSWHVNGSAMTKVIIPGKSFKVDLLDKDADFQIKTFALKRESLVSELRSLVGILEIAKILKQDRLYKLVFVPEGGKLFKDSTGNIKGVFYKDGKIIQHAKFRAVSTKLNK